MVPAFSPPASALSFTNPYASAIRKLAAPSLVDEAGAAFAPSATAVTADGLSAAVAVYRSTSDATVKFSLDGDSQVSLSPYTWTFLTNPQPGGTGELNVTPAFYDSSTKTYYSFALVWAPQKMPVSASDLADGHFSPVIAGVTATQSGASVRSSLEVLPPPVAMVHGVWSEGKAWSGLERYLSLRYPHQLLELVDYERDNYQSFSHDNIQYALAQKISSLLQKAANQGQVARSVDVVGHSMGGLATQWFMTHAPPSLQGAVHQLIGVGTPHQGSELATALSNNRTNKVTQSLNGTVIALICGYRQISPCTLESYMASDHRIVAGAIESLVPTSGELTALNQTTTSYKSILGLAPVPRSATEVGLNILTGAFIPDATVGDILGPTNDTIVGTASQRGNAQNPATITGIVHASLASQDVDETSSPAVWNQALYCLMGGTGPAPVTASSSSQLTNVRGTNAAAVASAPPPVFDLTGFTQVPATSVTFTPGTDSSLGVNSAATISASSSTKTITEIFFFQTIVDPADVSVLYATQAPFSVTFTPTRLGSVDLAAFAVFSDNTFATTPLHYSVPTSGVLNYLAITSAPFASLPVGISTTVRTTAYFDTGPVEVTTVATARARSGSAAVFSVGAGGLVTANGPGIDWLDVSYGGQTVSAAIRVGTCTFALGPVNQIVANTGGTTTIQVTAPLGCAWTAVTTDAWLNLTSPGGSGNGLVGITAAPNNSGASTRVGLVTVDNQNAAITQPNQSSAYTVTPAQINVPTVGGNGTIDVSSLCSIIVASSADWLLPTNLGSSVAYTVLANPAASPRTAILTVGSKTVPFTQSGSLQLLLDESVPSSNRMAALDSVLFLGDPFPVIDAANLFNHTLDRNTRLIIFMANLQLAQGETASSVVVDLVDANNKSYDVAAEDVRPVSNFEFTQVTFRLPDNLSVGTCSIKVKAHGEVSSAGTMRIRI